MTVRRLVSRAMRQLGVLDAGEAPGGTQGSQAIEAFEALIASLPNSNRWTDVEVATDYTAGENERIRVTTADAVTITVPVGVSGSQRLIGCCGTVRLICSAAEDRAPRDFARVQVTDALSDENALYYYRSDIAQWTSATGLTLDSESPLSAAYDMGLTAMLAIVLAPEYGVDISPVVANLAERFERTLWQLNPPDLLIAPDVGLRKRTSYERF